VQFIQNLLLIFFVNSKLFSYHYSTLPLFFDLKRHRVSVVTWSVTLYSLLTTMVMPLNQMLKVINIKLIYNYISYYLGVIISKVSMLYSFCTWHTTLQLIFQISYFIRSNYKDDHQTQVSTLSSQIIRSYKVSSFETLICFLSPPLPPVRYTYFHY
jgi:hypothetical protein